MKFTITSTVEHQKSIHSRASTFAGFYITANANIKQPQRSAQLPVMSYGHRSLFMELPTEVRENILRYLLVASYTTTEHNVRSKEVSRHPSGS